MIDLALYEMGNVLLRSLGWRDPMSQTSSMTWSSSAVPRWRSLRSGSARRPSSGRSTGSPSTTPPGQPQPTALGVPLVSADAQLQAAGLAESPAAVARRLRLPLGS